MNASDASSMQDWGVLLLVYGVPLAALVIFGFLGAWIERRHYASIRAREAATAHLPATNLRTLDSDRAVQEAWLVTASVVISIDYFKRFLAGWRKIFGGRVRSYETLLDRARREALLRLKEQCPQVDLIANLRFDTACIANARGRRQTVAGVEVLASGTAIRFARAAAGEASLRPAMIQRAQS
jgi:uncharacterized protein YbjQ (UPF0145 family)